jgi:hypothetical protein
MAIIPGSAKVLNQYANVNTTYGGSSAMKAQSKWYTMDDVIETINAQPVITQATATVIGGVVRDFNVSPLFSYLANSFNYYYPLVGLTYPNERPPLKSFNGLGPLYCYGTPTEVVINGVEAIVLNSAALSLSLGSLSQMQKITLEDLIYVYGNFASFTISAGSSLNSVLMPNLEFWSGNISFNSTSPITTFDFPKLKVVGVIATNNAALQTINLPELLQGGYVNTLSSGIQSIILPKLKFLVGLNLSGTKSSLTSIQLPVVEYCPQINFPSDSTSLSTFTFGSSLKFYGSNNTIGNFITLSNSLDQASVDNILISLAALDGTNGTTEFSNRTVTITGFSATPSSTGLAAKSALVARGCTVTTN